MAKQDSHAAAPTLTQTLPTPPPVLTYAPLHISRHMHILGLLFGTAGAFTMRSVTLNLKAAAQFLLRHNEISEATVPVDPKHTPAVCGCWSGSPGR